MNTYRSASLWKSTVVQVTVIGEDFRGGLKFSLSKRIHRNTAYQNLLASHLERNRLGQQIFWEQKGVSAESQWYLALNLTLGD